MTSNDDYFLSLCRILYRNTKDKSRINSLIKDKYKTLKAMQDKEKYLKDLKIKKEKSIKAIEKIDKILEDDNLLIKEFNKRNSKLEDMKKILNLKSLKYILVKEKQIFENNIKEADYLEKNSNFVKRRNELIQFLEIVSERYEQKEEIIELQKNFLNFIDKKISKITDRNDFIDILYEIRYYRNIMIFENKYTKECEELEKQITKILKKIIIKCCKLGYMKIFSMDINLNYDIINYAIDTKIINLEEIRVYFEYSKEEMTIKVYDKEIFEKQGMKKIENPNKQLEVKQKKMLKIFN